MLELFVLSFYGSRCSCIQFRKGFVFVCLAVFMRALGGFLGLRLEGWAIGVSRQGSIGDLGLFGFRVSGIFGFRVLSIRVLGS